jgi:hypothetical protein
MLPTADSRWSLAPSTDWGAGDTAVVVKIASLWNSGEWLQGPRLSNANQSVGIVYPFAMDAFLGPLLRSSDIYSSRRRSALGQSRCHKGSRLLNFNNSTLQGANLVVFYTGALDCVSAPASSCSQGGEPTEYTKRVARTVEKRNETLGRSILNAPPPNSVVGANMRVAAVPALMAGLASDRIVLFVNNAPTVLGHPSCSNHGLTRLVSVTMHSVSFYPRAHAR